MFRKVTVCLALMTLGMSSALAHWTNYAKISQIVVNGDKSVRIWTAENGGKWASSTATGCLTADYIQINASTPALTQFFSGLLSAKAASQRVRFEFTNACTNPSVYTAGTLMVE